MKRCCQCKEDKSSVEFYANRSKSDGLSSLCKACNAAHVKAYRVAHPAQHAAYVKAYRKRPGSAEKLYAYNQRSEIERPEKYKARIAVTTALQSGRLVRKPCSVCGNPKTDAHHPDYSRPLDVRWLCRKHHLEIHREERRVAISS